ncbi:MAG: hypothetical protein HYY35_00410 [Deltaproteobacteria bacterium]|nr:hypothetical protein [Deltaproteobacteria bacterium]
MPAEEPSLAEEIAHRTGLPLDAVAAVVDEALVNQLHRFRRGALYTFDAATPEDLAALSEASSEPAEIVEAVLIAIGDVAKDWIPEEVVDGEG